MIVSFYHKKQGLDRNLRILQIYSNDSNETLKGIQIQESAGTEKNFENLMTQLDKFTQFYRNFRYIKN